LDILADGVLQMSANRVVPGAGYDNVYVDSLVAGGHVWDIDPYTKVANVNFMLGAHSLFDRFEAEHGSGGLITDPKMIKIWTESDVKNWLSAIRTINEVSNLDLNWGYGGGTSFIDIVAWKVELGPADKAYAKHESPDNGNFKSLWGYYNTSALNWNYTSPGSKAFSAMLHELGHALGLDHTHEGLTDPDATSFPGVDQIGSPGDHDLNHSVYSVMSYIDGAPNRAVADKWGHSVGLGAFDIAALQAIYGANMGANYFDDVYLLPQANVDGTGWRSIWDTNGTDTISGEGATQDLRIDLRAATLITDDPGAGGYISEVTNVSGGFTIANKVVIENAIGGDGNDNLTGNEAGNKLVGNKGDDELIGGSGIDLLIGGTGDDQYYVDTADDQVVELKDEGEMDAIVTSVDFALPSNVEQLFGRGSESLVLAGNTLDNVLNGGGGNDILHGLAGHDSLGGGAGNDTMYGGAGDDVYYVDSAGDVIVDTSGNDTVYSKVAFDPGASIENYYLNGVKQTLGGPVKPVDRPGTKGKDVLKGGADADRLFGGLGNDKLTGGPGPDTFVFNTKPGKTNMDTVTDFNPMDDTIELAKSVFKKIPKKGLMKKDYFHADKTAKDKKDFILYDKKKGGLYYDADGSGDLPAVQFAKIGAKLKLAASDFKIA
jgi:Ca2+-binding RTX toxin-like protein